MTQIRIEEAAKAFRGLSESAAKYMSVEDLVKYLEEVVNQSKLANHDCTKCLEDGCTCDTLTDEEARQLLDESIEADVEDLTDFDL